MIRPASKRLFDLSIATIGIVLFCPIWLLIALLILIDDGKPIIFKQQRLGKDKQLFSLIKFRSMRDNKITRVGHRIRLTGLDETLQFIAVIKGDMSIVGPRPLTKYDIERLNWNTAEYEQRWASPPGITGLAQLFAGSGARVSWFLDCKYSQNSSVLFDTYIVIASFAVNIFGKKRVKPALRKLSKYKYCPTISYLKLG